MLSGDLISSIEAMRPAVPFICFGDIAPADPDPPLLWSRERAFHAWSKESGVRAFLADAAKISRYRLRHNQLWST